MKKSLVIIFAALLCLSMTSCKEKAKTVTIESEIVGEGGYEMKLKETIIIAPDGNTIEPYQPIADDAIVKTVEEITGLNHMVTVFESCYNGVYTAQYDTNTTLASDTNYYLVTNYTSVAQLREELLKVFANEDLINLLWTYDGFKEEGGKLYYRPIGEEAVIFKAEESTINYSNDVSCELSVPMYNSKNKNIGVYNIEFEKTESGFIISYLTE